MNVQNNAFDYTPKKSRAPKIIAQIVSVIFTACMLLMFFVFLDSDEPKFVYSESVNLYSTNMYDVYELKDLTVASCYASDFYDEYYLVLFPDQDETIKAASFCCETNSAVSSYIKNSIYNKNAEFGDCVIHVGVTVDNIDLLAGKTIEAYENAVDSFKESGLNIVPTELSLEFACAPNKADFEAYCHSEEVFNNGMIILFLVLTLLGVVAAVFSFKERKRPNSTATYYNPNFEQQY